MGILLAFGRLSQHGEVVAMKAAGIPLKRVVLPVIAVGALLSVGCLWIQDRVQPWAIGRMYHLVLNELEGRLTLDALEPGVMHEFRGWRVYIGRKDPGTGVLHDITILKPEDDQQRFVAYHASSAQLELPGRPRPDAQAGPPSLEMRRGHYIPSPSGENVTCATFESLRITLPQFTPKDLPKIRTAMTIRELCARQGQLAQAYSDTPSELTKDDLKKERQEIADRLSLPFSCLAVCLVAAPIGARAKRSGRSYTFTAGLAIILVYYILTLLMEPRSLHTLPVVILRMWVPNAALCLAGAVLVWRVDRV